MPQGAHEYDDIDDDEADMDSPEDLDIVDVDEEDVLEAGVLYSVLRCCAALQ